MQYIKLIYYILTHGSLSSINRNYALKKADTIKGLKIDRKSVSRGNFFSGSTILRSIYINFSYIKTCWTYTPKYFALDNSNFAYLRIPKCASTSLLEQFIKSKNHELRTQTMTDDQIDVLSEDFSQENIDHLQIFTIARSPFRRLVSLYVKVFYPSNNFFVYQNYLFGIIKLDFTFHEFVKVISVIPHKLMEQHIRPQYLFYPNKKLKTFKLETQKLELKKFLAQYDITLSQKNKSIDYDYREFYNSEILELVADIYKKDIEILEYQEELKLLRQYCKNKRN